MCVSVAGKIVEINGGYAKVSVNHNICDINIKLLSPKIGDYVLIHSGMAIEIIKKDTAEEIMSIFEELSDDIGGN